MRHDVAQIAFLLKVNNVGIRRCRNFPPVHAQQILSEAGWRGVGYSSGVSVGCCVLGEGVEKTK